MHPADAIRPIYIQKLFLSQSFKFLRPCGMPSYDISCIISGIMADDEQDEASSPNLEREPGSNGANLALQKDPSPKATPPINEQSHREQNGTITNVSYTQFTCGSAFVLLFSGNLPSHSKQSVCEFQRISAFGLLPWWLLGERTWSNLSNGVLHFFGILMYHGDFHQSCYLKRRTHQAEHNRQVNQLVLTSAKLWKL